MDTVLFVKNVKEICKNKGIKPTVACKESRAGANFINNIESQGSIPSVAKVQMLAAYLGVTTSELLGEDLPGAADRPELLVKFDRLSPEGQKELLAFLDFKLGLESGGEG